MSKSSRRINIEVNWPWTWWTVWELNVHTGTERPLGSVKSKKYAHTWKARCLWSSNRGCTYAVKKGKL